MYRTPHALHNVLRPSGPLRHCGVVVVPHCKQPPLLLRLRSLVGAKVFLMLSPFLLLRSLVGAEVGRRVVRIHAGGGSKIRILSSLVRAMVTRRVVRGPIHHFIHKS